MHTNTLAMLSDRLGFQWKVPFIPYWWLKLRHSLLTPLKIGELNIDQDKPHNINVHTQTSAADTSAQVKGKFC